MKTLKKLSLAVMLLGLMCILMVGLGTISSAQSLIKSGNCGAYGDNVTWELYDDGLLVISGEGDMEDYNECEVFADVTPLPPYSQYSCDDHYYVDDYFIKKIIINDGVTGVGTSAFASLHLLEEINIPDSVTSIGNDAFKFSGYYNKTTNWKNDVLYIGKHLIEAKDNITYCEIKNGTITISEEAFAHCKNLKNITVPNSVTTICEAAFMYCSNITSITIPDSVTAIYNSAFEGCTSLTSITIPESIAKIDNYTFKGCKGLKNVKIPASVTSIGKQAFYNCSSLNCITIFNSECEIFDSSSIVYGATIFGYAGSTAQKYAENNGRDFIPIKNDDGEIDNADALKYTVKNGEVSITDCNTVISGELIIPETIEGCPVTAIGASVFSDCDMITSITIPASVANIGDNAFDNCASLTRIDVDKNNVNFASVDGVLFSKTLRLLKKYPEGKTDATYFLPDDVYRILPYAFSSCKYLEDIVFNKNITIIEKYAFRNCIALKTLTIPEQLTTIGNYAFSDCKLLTKINWNAKSVTSSSNVFSNAGTSCGGFELVFGDTVGKIPGGVFYRCTSLISISISDSVTEIGRSAFEDCSNLKSVKMGNALTVIGDSAFQSCKKLTEITIPDSVTTVGAFSFYNCQGLEKLIFGKSVTKIGTYAFNYCKSLTSITIPDSVKIIGSYVFRNCENLSYIEWNASRIGTSNYVFDGAGKKSANGGIDVVFGENIKTIPAGLFINAYVKSVTIPASVTKIGGSAFYNCTIIEEITIPDAVTTIGNSAFAGCTSLKSISLPESVTTIGSSAFAGCASMNHIYIYNPDCISANNSKDIIYKNTVIHGHTGYPVEEFANKYGYDFMELHTVPDEWFITATCVKAGVKYHKCNYCDNKYDITDVAATGCHNYENIIKPATPTRGGKIEYKCIGCNDILFTTPIYYPKTITLSATSFIYNGKAKAPSVTVKDSQGKTLKKSIDYTVTYSSGRTNVGKYAVTIKFKGNYSGTVTKYFLILPGKTTKITTTTTATTLKAQWNKVTGATGYKVEVINSSGKVVKTVHTRNNYYTFSGLTTALYYKVKVTAYKTINEVNNYSLVNATTSTYTAPSTPTLTLSSTAKGKATIKWSNVNRETGYQVYYSTSKNGTYSKVATYSANYISGSKSKLTSGKTYYFKVRAYKKVGNTVYYSGWSTVKSVKIK